MLKRNFTLVELMIAIAIIAILAGMLIAAANGAIKKAEKAKAKSGAVELVNAIRHYQSEYGVLPVASFSSSSCLDGNTSKTAYQTFIKMLQGDDTACTSLGENSRRIQFLEKTNNGDDEDIYKDPWDKNFIIYVDHNQNGQISGITGLIKKADSDDDAIVYQPAVVLSYGPKGKSNDYSNFVYSLNVDYVKAKNKYVVTK